MAIVSTTEIWSGRGGGIQTKGFERKYTRTFLVRTDDMRDGPLRVLFNDALPQLWDSYEGPNGEFDTGAVVVAYDPKQAQDDPFTWEVAVQYSSLVGGELLGRGRDQQAEMARDAQTMTQAQQENPLLRPPSIRWSGQKYQRPLRQSLEVARGRNMTIGSNAYRVTPDGYTVTADNVGMGLRITGGTGWRVKLYIIATIGPGNTWNLSYGPANSANLTGGRWTLGGDPVASSAFEPFDPLPEVDDTRPVLTISKNVLFFDQTELVAYQDAVNTDAFFGAQPGQAKVDNMTADSAFENGLYYWKRDYTFHFRREGWLITPLNQGFRRLVEARPAAPPEPATYRADLMLDNGTSQPITTPALLDAAGGRLAADGTPFYRRFLGYKRLPFATLNLP